MKLLNIHEEDLEKEGGQDDSSSNGEGEILSNYGSLDEENEYVNQHTITRYLEILTERLNALRRHNLCLTRPSEDDAPDTSRRVRPQDISCFKCKSFDHYTIDCPTRGMEVKPSKRWKALNCTGFRREDCHTKLKKKNGNPRSSSSSGPVTDFNSHVVIESNMKRMSQLASAYAGMTMDFKDEISESESDDEELPNKTERGYAFVAHASASSSTKYDSDSNDDEKSKFCFMAKA